MHSFRGPAVAAGLQQVATFLREHPAEVLLLDFNHIYNFDSVDRHLEFLHLVRSASRPREGVRVRLPSHTQGKCEEADVQAYSSRYATMSHQTVARAGSALAAERGAGQQLSARRERRTLTQVQ